MKELDNRQKKIIRNTFFILGILITISGLIIWILNDTKILNNALWSNIIGKLSVFAPTIIGVIIKIYISIFMRKQNIKAIDNHLIESGIKPLSEIKQSNKQHKNKSKDIKKSETITYGYV